MGAGWRFTVGVWCGLACRGTGDNRNEQVQALVRRRWVEAFASAVAYLAAARQRRYGVEVLLEHLDLALAEALPCGLTPRGGTVTPGRRLSSSLLNVCQKRTDIEA